MAEFIKNTDLKLARQALLENEQILTHKYFCTGANPNGHLIEVKVLLSMGEKPPSELPTCPFHPTKKPKLVS